VYSIAAAAAAAAAVWEQAEWTLDTVLSLPWRPRVSILGSTIYTLNSDANQVLAKGLVQPHIMD
jgi:hypothetical protein